MMNNVVDKLVDTFEATTSNQTSRTGDAAARIASSLRNGVHPDVIAHQLSLNSEKNCPSSPINFTSEDIVSINKLYAANQRRSAFTKGQARSIIREQQAFEDDLSFAS